MKEPEISVAQAHQRRRGKRFERHADPQIRGAPENAHADQRDVSARIRDDASGSGYHVSLILTLTINPAIDRTITVDKLVFEDRGYILDRTEAAGGRGINASQVIHAFGGKTLALLTAGGAVGEKMEKSLAGMGFPFESVRVPPTTPASTSPFPINRGSP